MMEMFVGVCVQCSAGVEWKSLVVAGHDGSDVSGRDDVWRWKTFHCGLIRGGESEQGGRCDLAARSFLAGIGASTTH